MIGGQGEDSCGKSEISETQQKGKARTEINSKVKRIYTSSFIQFVRPVI
ncbi:MULTISPECIES: hypothetical protein [Priestia]|nr:hypothetical protein [Priestia megaterium]